MYTCKDCYMYWLCRGSELCNTFVPDEEYFLQDAEIAEISNEKDEYAEAYYDYITGWQ